MSGPLDVAFDGQNLVAADGGNNRVLVFESLPTAIGQPAQLVLGQSSFTTNITGPDYTYLDQRTSVALIRGRFHSIRVAVSDAGKHRLVFFAGVVRRDLQ